MQSLSQAVDSNLQGHRWVSSGSDGTYAIYDCADATPGTKIILNLKADSAEFSKQSIVDAVIRKYSNFIGVPVFLNGKQINVVDPVWAKDPSKARFAIFPHLIPLIIGYGRGI